MGIRRQLAREERADFADFLSTLRPEQWDEPTLCDSWTVRDVVAHVISYEGHGPRDVAVRFAKGGMRLSGANTIALAEYRAYSPDELLARLRRHLDPTGLTNVFGGSVALTDCCIHHQDIRRPFGMPREIPPDRLVEVLRFALLAPPIGAFVRARGLRLEATDLDFTRGNGPEVQGPAESILMAIAGRRGAVDELSGPGQPILSNRIAAK
ncbi:uncharacterized protein (TIGR03083 family) [Tamaricihabitans halophyticus]|uniref:Uncharacterized protein (TIGR03083 family) n=1 Tax=Tamaricihabitans halophyticus TaxID=1262583 RepID=A0A4R2QSZ8_9PSEU|nr:maleylpyruvate isomerase family mycothiol-dependent enzyme [Tamaricihabitans halophyticus]TCP52099.1 uncharacterized protein (TIGR03083 family) [Tamaricihabitans halophyticus]